MVSPGVSSARFQAAARQFFSLQSIVMLQRDDCRAVMLRVEPRSASSRTTFCFESNHVLLRVEVRSASSRTTLREAYPACTSAVVQWHETHRAGLPEGRVDRRTGHLARPPSMPSAGCQAVGGSAPRRVRNIGCCRYGRPRSDRRCKRRLTQGAG